MTFVILFSTYTYNNFAHSLGTYNNLLSVHPHYLVFLLLLLLLLLLMMLLLLLLMMILLLLLFSVVFWIFVDTFS